MPRHNTCPCSIKSIVMVVLVLWQYKGSCLCCSGVTITLLKAKAEREMLPHEFICSHQFVTLGRARVQTDFPNRNTSVWRLTGSEADILEYYITLRRVVHGFWKAKRWEAKRLSFTPNEMDVKSSLRRNRWRAMESNHGECPLAMIQPLLISHVPVQCVCGVEREREREVLGLANWSKDWWKPIISFMN